MKKIIEYIKKIGFKFSFKRLRKAILLILFFSIIGCGVYFFYRFESSEPGLKILYEKEIANKIDIDDKIIIRILKKDINDDKKLDYIFIAGKEKTSGDGSLNSSVDLYEDVIFVIIDGHSNEQILYSTEKNYKPNVSLKICEDEKNRYFMISDYDGNIDILKLKENNITNIIDNTVNGDFLGYTIYTEKNKENDRIIDVKLDNYDKSYLKTQKKVKQLDFSENDIDLTKYRETYLRDKFSKFELKDADNNGIFEFVATQYVLYNLEENSVNKTAGKIEVYFKIESNKLVYDKVEVSI